jgi:hypothetical protein
LASVLVFPLEEDHLGLSDSHPGKTDRPAVALTNTKAN